jgi:uncharacterized protein (DUF924 family)
MEARWSTTKDFLKMARFQADSHFEVLKRFGRYPNRKQYTRRVDASEERECLSDHDKLPAWAKSQLSKKE